MLTQLPTGLAVATVGRMPAWGDSEQGVLWLPSGRGVRGRGFGGRGLGNRGLGNRGLGNRGLGNRGLGNRVPARVAPEFGLYLQGRPPPPMDWETRWVRWPDWWLPIDRNDARAALIELWQRAESHRVEVACGGGRGRTGTALACLAVLDGIAPADAVSYVRRHYHLRAVETSWQRRYVEHFTP